MPTLEALDAALVCLYHACLFVVGCERHEGSVKSAVITLCFHCKPTTCKTHTVLTRSVEVMYLLSIVNIPIKIIILHVKIIFMLIFYC